MTDSTATPSPPDDPLDRAIASLNAAVPVRPGLDRRTRQRAARRTRSLWAGGSLGAASVAAAALLLTHQGAPVGQITFAVNAPAGTGVSLVGDFNEWQPGRMRLTSRGDHWEVTLRLPPGRYRFAYVTDRGDWLPDPVAAPVPDDFGRPTSVLTVASQ
jgi:1,4-alpha-glucan branching enzyme